MTNLTNPNGAPKVRNIRSLQYPGGFPLYFINVDGKVSITGWGGKASAESRAYRACLQADTKRRILLNRKLRAATGKQVVWTGNGASYGNPHAFVCT